MTRTAPASVASNAAGVGWSVAPQAHGQATSLTEVTMGTNSYTGPRGNSKPKPSTRMDA
jgi:hypothetical protein